MVKKVIRNLDLSKASGPDCILVVVVKNSGPEPSYILAECFKKCLKESCFPDCWKASSLVPISKNIGKRSTVKNYHSVSLPSVVNKVSKKLVNKSIVDYLENVAFSVISSMVLGLPSQLQIFSRLYLIELLWILTGLVLLELWHLRYPRDINSLFTCAARLWNPLPIKCFSLTYNLSSFTSRINRHLLTVGSF